MTSRFFLSPGLRVQRSLAISSALLISCAASAESAEFKFEFGPGKAQPGYSQVTPETSYDAQRHFGFLQSESAAQPKVFAVDVEEGS